MCASIPIRRRRGTRVAIRDDMKMNRIMETISIMMLLLISCGEKEKIVNVPVNCAPDVPHGVYSTNYDGTVLICWVANYESDMDGYNVYRSVSLDDPFSPIGTVYVTSANPAEYCYEDLDTGNGFRYYYAVSAFDKGGAESDIIVEEVVTGTPRPEGQLTLYDRDILPRQSGFDFYPSLTSVAQRYDSVTTDIYFDVSGAVPLIVARRVGVEIQDYGYATDRDAIGTAPDDGWAPSRSVEAIANHMYFLQVLEGTDIHYAKIYVTAVTGDHATFYWAYQTDPFNPDLAPPAPGRGTGTLSSAPRESGALPGLNTEAKLTDRFSDPPIVERG